MPAKRANIGVKAALKHENGPKTAILQSEERREVEAVITIVYYCLENGFVLSCQISWEHKDEKFKNPHFEGTVEVAGTYGDHIFTRIYSVISYILDSEGYRKATLYSTPCCNTAKTFFVHDLCLIAFRGKRPEGSVGHHLGGVADNRIRMLKWSIPSEIGLCEAQTEATGGKVALEYLVCHPKSPYAKRKVRQLVGEGALKAALEHRNGRTLKESMYLVSRYWCPPYYLSRVRDYV